MYPLLPPPLHFSTNRSQLHAVLHILSFGHLRAHSTSERKVAPCSFSRLHSIPQRGPTVCIEPVAYEQAPRWILAVINKVEMNCLTRGSFGLCASL